MGMTASAALSHSVMIMADSRGIVTELTVLVLSGAMFQHQTLVLTYSPVQGLTPTGHMKPVPHQLVQTALRECDNPASDRAILAAVLFGYMNLKNHKIIHITLYRLTLSF